jgi:hypothetical protein
MPRISEFYGIVIYMYYRDHAPPHFHAEYAGQKAEFRIQSGRLLRGSLPPNARRLIAKWRAEHEAELIRNWELARAKEPLMRIEPLR